jgi:hypothetical protein
VNKTHPPKQCFDADDAKETPKCDSVDLTRDAVTGEWQVCSDAKTGMCGDGLNFGIDRSSLPEHELCKDADNADQLPKCKVADSDPVDQTRDPKTGNWVECDAGFAPCGDGLNPKVNRDFLASEKHETCKDADNADQVPMCFNASGDDTEQTRDPTNGKWQDCSEGYGACGDGLKAGINRSVLDTEKHDTCKNKAGDAEEVPTCGESKDKITRDSTSGVWGKCPDEEPVNPCGDGFDPGVDRTEPEKPVCLAVDNETPEAQMCEDTVASEEDAAIVRGRDGKWGCPDQLTYKACGDGLNPGVDRAEPEALKCFEADNETAEKP